MKKHVITLSGLFLTMLFISSLTFAAGDSTKGRTVYEAFCVGCHGFNGGGDGPESADMNPKPTNFTDPTTTGKLTSEDIERAIVIGKPDTAMKGFGNILTKEDIENLLAYLSSLMGK